MKNTIKLFALCLLTLAGYNCTAQQTKKDSADTGLTDKRVTILNLAWSDLFHCEETVKIKRAEITNLESQVELHKDRLADCDTIRTNCFSEKEKLVEVVAKQSTQITNLKNGNKNLMIGLAVSMGLNVIGYIIIFNPK